jgi:Ner family transcriptional regulator
MERKVTPLDLRHEQIKHALKLKGILLTDVAKELGVTPGLVSGALRGRFRSARVEIVVAALLETTPETLWPDRTHKQGGLQ